MRRIVFEATNDGKVLVSGQNISHKEHFGFDIDGTGTVWSKDAYMITKHTEFPAETVEAYANIMGVNIGEKL